MIPYTILLIIHLLVAVKQEHGPQLNDCISEYTVVGEIILIFLVFHRGYQMWTVLFQLGMSNMLWSWSTNERGYSGIGFAGSSSFTDESFLLREVL